MTSEAELLDGWAAGVPGAADALVSRHYERVRRFFELRVADVAEDLTQRTFLACVEGRVAFRADGTFRAFLFGIARRQLAMHLRGRDREQRLVRFAEAAGSPTRTTPTGMVAIKEEQRLVLRAFQELSDEQKVAVELFYWERMSLEEIGRVLQLSTSAVTSRLDRARTAMRAFVEGLNLRPKTRSSLLGDLEGWTHSMSGRVR